ncbi:MAG: hypothetical protein J4472_00900 [DPANN group archaeon]|nr:hypothetical protein [DPANN group archaeon]
MVTTLASGEIVLWAAVIGLLVGVIWSLRYIVIIDRRIERIENHIETLVGRRRADKTTKRRRTKSRRR